jgi:hypothetical protein
MSEKDIATSHEHDSSLGDRERKGSAASLNLSNNPQAK